MQTLLGKKIILGVTGSISAYKSPMLVRELVKAGAEVNVVISESAQQFVTKEVLSNLSKNKVISHLFDKDLQNDGAWHIHLAHKADLMLIAPCSATTIARLANGLADSALSTLALALPSDIPILISPAMDSTMWENVAVQRNISQLIADGIIVIPPAYGELSSGIVGIGRLPEIREIVNQVQAHINSKRKINQLIEYKYEAKKDLNINSKSEKTKESNSEVKEEVLSQYQANSNIEKKSIAVQSNESNNTKGKKAVSTNISNKKVLISAGPTIEKIDDVRFISNFSSGKMGYALADEAMLMGANVTLVSGPVNISAPMNVKKIDVVTAEEMFNVMTRMADGFDIIIMCAAVADFTPVHKASGKLKKDQYGDHFTISFKKTKDILLELGKNKKENQTLIGFALESENKLENGRKKLESKKCDMIIVNHIGDKHKVFGDDYNTISILKNEGDDIHFPSMSKSKCAREILLEIL